MSAYPFDYPVDYPFDPDLLAEVAQRLYDAIPAMHRLPDQPPAGRGELKRMLDVLAVPLAVLRQSIQELHADFFIDTADDEMIPFLAGMVGTDLVFPDPDSNRRDVRGTVGWRRRKGTPSALQEMGSELTAQSVVLIEGWKRVQVTQDLNQLRPERVITQLRPAVVAEQVSGPLDAVSHSVDVRAISARTGRYHPKDVTHYVQPTITFPLIGGTATSLTVPGSDLRYAMDPLGVHRALLARRPEGERSPFLDRIQERHFAADPGRWFGQESGFTIRVLDLPAAIGVLPDAVRSAVLNAEQATGRAPSTRIADRLIGRRTVRLTVLDLPQRGWRSPIRIELGLASITGRGTGTWRPTAASFNPRSSVELDASGVISSAPAAGPAPGGTRVPLLRVSTPGAIGTFLPGVTLEVSSSAIGSRAAARSSGLAAEGFLRGVLHVVIPPMQIPGDRYLHIASDGSVYDGGSGVALRGMPEVAGRPELDPAARLAAGPGSAWPPLPAQAEPDFITSVPSAPGRGPAVAHGGMPVRVTASGSFAPVLVGTQCALAFAMQVESPGGATFRPFQRLSWTGADPFTGHWSVLDRSGIPVSSGHAAAEYARVAGERQELAGSFALAVRFECTQAGVSLCPGEVAWSGDDGHTVLIHLPQLDAIAVVSGDEWPSDPLFTAASEAIRAGQDGSTWASGSTAGRRISMGSIAPIGQAAGLRRRVVRGRRLCAWENEDWMASPPQILELTRVGQLDVDVQHGLFAFASEEPPQDWPPGPGGAQPPNVTYDCAEAATMHLGALPAAREPVLNRQLPAPTRLVTRDGTLHPGTPASWHDLPRYDSLTAALSSISARWQALTQQQLADAGGEITEVIQFEDSATYPVQAPTWPSAPADPAVAAAAQLSLVIQAAERERPAILIDPIAGWALPANPASYRRLSFTGMVMGGAGWTGPLLPEAEEVSLTLCTVLDGANIFRVASRTSGTSLSINLSQTGGLDLAGPGEIIITDSIVDAGLAQAIKAPAGIVQLDHCSVGGNVQVRILEASEVIFDGRIDVEDRFHGCIRFSRVATTEGLPRAHRLVAGTAIPVVSRNRRDPAWWRLRADGDPAITRGAENGTELGAFNLTQSAARMAGFEHRLAEFTPAGLRTGVIRID
jgi:hypothetical protein